jgi:hypothetical protein
MKVTIPYDPQWIPLKWAKKNCPSYITNDVTPVEPKRSLSDPTNQIYINYYFSEERDAMMFMLRWS